MADGAVHVFPVSVKGVAVQAGRVVLLRNERDEWELPGGKLEFGEDSAACMAREIGEEIGWRVSTRSLLDCWQYYIGEGRDVLIVTYGCHMASTAPPVVSSEHKQAALFAPGQVSGLTIISRKLSIPPHVFGVTDPGDADFLAMIQFARSAIRLAEIARQCGQPAEAVSELWPLIAQLEARIGEARPNGRWRSWSRRQGSRSASRWTMYCPMSSLLRRRAGPAGLCVSRTTGGRPVWLVGRMLADHKHFFASAGRTCPLP